MALSVSSTMTLCSSDPYIVEPFSFDVLTETLTLPIVELIWGPNRSCIVNKNWYRHRYWYWYWHRYRYRYRFRYRYRYRYSYRYRYRYSDLQLRC